MKKIYQNPTRERYDWLRKLFKIMKLTFFLVFVSTMIVSAGVYSQNTRLNLDYKNISIGELLQLIEQQSEYRFAYSKSRLNPDERITLDVKNENLDQIMKIIPDKEQLTYKINDRYVEISDNTSSEKNNSQQQKSVSGKVTDSNGTGLPGVSIVVKGTTSGTISDGDGKYYLADVPQDAVLQFSFVGMKGQEITVSGKTSINVKLIEETVGIEEVVVVGYGVQKKSTLTGSVSITKGSDLTIAPVTNLSNSLSGKLSGVFVSTGSSEPGNDGSTITIRGISTFGNSAPLVVVDGVPGRSLDRIDPNTIDNISVLKDASAAIYGAQAANGVILITTKRGKLGKPTIDLSYNQGFGAPTTLPIMTNSSEYATLLNEIDLYNGVPGRYSDNDLKLYQDKSDPLGHPNTNWYAEALKSSSPQNLANVSISGGSESFQYFISGSSKFQDGFYKNSSSKYKQQSFTANLDGKINQYISLRANISGRLENTNASPVLSQDIFNDVSRSKPTDIAYWPNGMPGPGVENGSNPVVLPTSEVGYNNTENYVFNSNLNLKIDAPWVKGLSLNLLAALDEGFQYNKMWRTPWNTYTWDGSSKETNGDPVLTKTQWGGDPKLSQRNDKSQNLLTSALLNYKSNISENQAIELLVGVEKIRGNSSYLQAFRRYFISTAIDEISQGGAKEINNGGSSYLSERLNYFGRANYNLRNRYMVEFQWRYQGSYIFSKENRFGFFPGVSLGYVVSEEDFWKNSLGNSISFFKIRASYGKTGNDLINPYQYLTSYYTGPLNLIVNGGSGAEAALYENVIPNTNASWESATQRDLGVDLRFLNGNLGVTADVFSNSRNNILSQRNASVPASAGLSLPAENIGKAENKGFDFDISYRNKPSSNGLSYQISFNGVYSKNKLLFWDETPGAPDYQKAEGSPLFSSLYYVSLGVFKDQAAIDKYPHWDGARPGDIIFQDTNGDKIIDANDKVRSQKTNIPTTSGALTFNLKYKDFDLSTVFQGAAGAERYIFGFSGEVGNFYKDFYDSRWTESNPNATGPRTYNRDNVYWATADNQSQESTMFLYKTNYIRMKTLEIGYSIPSSVISKIGIRNLRVYFSGYNLFTIASGLPKGFDPEMSYRLGFGYPVQKVINFGINLGL